MLDHVSLGVRDLPSSSAFYDAVLQPLGYVRVWSKRDATGYGTPGGEDRLALFAVADPGSARAGFHLALTAPTREAVRGFHLAARALGAVDEGEPALRPRYGPHYFAAFVQDPDGYRLEAVCHTDEGGR